MEAVLASKVERKGILRNEKGLTLIELLAVLVIIAIIAAIAIPSVSSIIGKSKDNAHKANAQLIIDAARNRYLVGDLEAAAVTSPVTLQTLYNDGYLETMPKDPQGTGSYSPTATQVSWTTTNNKTTFSITLVADGTGGKTYLSNVSEENIKTSTIGTPPPENT